MKAIITGAHGNLGTHLLRRLPVSPLIIHKDNWKLLETIKKGEFNAAIHLAYDLRHKFSDTPATMIKSNILSTTELLESVRKLEIPEFIFVSSCAVYGNTIDTTEKQRCTPLSINGIVKQLNEEIIQEFCTKNQISYKIFRIFNLYGGIDHFSIFHHLNNALNKGIPFILNNDGISQRDFIHVEDVAEIISKLLTTKHSYSLVNIGTGISTRIADLINPIRKKYPNLKVLNTSCDESEYSRANISRLNSLITHQSRCVIDYIEDTYKLKD